MPFELEIPPKCAELDAAMREIREKLAEVAQILEKDRSLRSAVIAAIQEVLGIEILDGLISICSHCRRLRQPGTDPKDRNNWVPLEKYLLEHSEADLSHGCCPDCVKKFYPDIVGYGEEN